ncbi:MAG: alpha-galactosidase, partial [Gammaproteobacteria bacterium]|nr:alpha-galactosidase [Gammaproteobacteria bacterium]
MEILQYTSVRPSKRSRAIRNLFHALLAIGLAATSSPNLSAQQAPLAHFAPPPMGWGSWNSFSNTVDSRIVAAQGRAMVATGMRSAGYQMVMIEEGWWPGNR